MKNKDSPFALLAKENDIMWGGGMPDDTTVIVLRVINANYNPNLPFFNNCMLYRGMRYVQSTSK